MKQAHSSLQKSSDIDQGMKRMLRDSGMKPVNGCELPLVKEVRGNPAVFCKRNFNICPWVAEAILVGCLCGLFLLYFFHLLGKNEHVGVGGDGDYQALGGQILHGTACEATCARSGEQRNSTDAKIFTQATQQQTFMEPSSSKIKKK